MKVKERERQREGQTEEMLSNAKPSSSVKQDFDKRERLNQCPQKEGENESSLTHMLLLLLLLMMLKKTCPD